MNNASTVYTKPENYVGKTIPQFQKEIHEWSTRNFGDRVEIQYDVQPLLKMMVELGRLSHWVLKLSQGIRGASNVDSAEKAKLNLAFFGISPTRETEPEPSVDISSFLDVIEEVGEVAEGILAHNQNDVVDGIADILVFLLDFCGRNGINAEAILHETWNKVKQRDWKKNPDNAHDVVEK